MIIFGTRGVTTTPDRGNFHCPSCNSKMEYELKRVRKFFTLFFIPVIPLDDLGEYVECMACKNSYKPDVLNYDPVANAREVEAEFHAAIKKVMIHILLADGVIDDSEVDTVQDVYQQITGNQIEKNRLLDEIKLIEKSEEDFASMLVSLQGCLNDEGKEMVVKAALYVARADGEIQEEEKEMLVKIGKNLGMTQAHLRGVVSGAG
jgi:uncharacterized tellurite resistance protein B-like protein